MPAKSVSLLALLFHGAIFGFFYAWVCSTMWGLDAADPKVAISAMQAMNASVRNAVFAPTFFGTPIVSGLAALVLWRVGQTRATFFMLAAVFVYICGAFVPTVLVNVPMNEALAAATVPADTSNATSVWQTYSSKWQFWNQIRTGASGIALLLVGLGIFAQTRT